jgi:hypothetical protein
VTSGRHVGVLLDDRFSLRYGRLEIGIARSGNLILKHAQHLMVILIHGFDILFIEVCPEGLANRFTSVFCVSLSG